MSKLTKEQIIAIAEEMYSEGTYYSEKYSARSWKKHDWPEVDDDRLYTIFDSHIRFLRTFDEYNGKKEEHDNEHVGVLRGIPPVDW